MWIRVAPVSVLRSCIRIPLQQIETTYNTPVVFRKYNFFSKIGQHPITVNGYLKKNILFILIFKRGLVRIFPRIFRTWVPDFYLLRINYCFFTIRD